MKKKTHISFHKEITVFSIQYIYRIYCFDLEGVNQFEFLFIHFPVKKNKG